MKISRLITFLIIGAAGSNFYAFTSERKQDEDTIPTVLDLPEIVVKASRPYQRISKGGSVIDVKNTMLSKSGTLIDVLERIPAVKRAKNGFEIIGKGVPTIYLDGRKVYDTNELQTLRSELISNIEVITNPGPEYGATTTAVIKITSIRETTQGFGADGSLDYTGPSHTDLGGRAGVAYRTAKAEFFGHLSYRRENETEEQNIIQIANNDPVVTQKSQYKVNFTTKRIEGLCGFNYKAGEGHTIGARYNITRLPACDYKMNMFSDIYENSDLSTKLRNDIHLHRNGATNHQLNANYRGSLNGIVANVNIDYIHSTEGQSQTNLQSGESTEETHITAENRSTSDLYTLRGEVAGRIGKGNATGGIDLSNLNRLDSYNNSDPAIGSSDGILKERLGAAYVTYSVPTQIGEFEAGTRLEHSYFRYTGDKAIERRETKIFPTASWQRRFGQLQIQIQYGTKIQRPRYKELSNEVIYVNSYTLTTGNPQLKNAIHREISLTGRWKAFTLSTSMRKTSNAIVYWGETYKDDAAVTLLKMKNLKSMTKSLTTLTWATVFGRFTPVVSTSCVKQWLSTGGKKFNKPIFTASMSNSLNMGKGWTGMVDFNFRSRGNTDNAMLNDNVFTLSASLRKSIANKKGVIQLKLSDILNDSQDNSTLYFPPRSLTQRTKWDSRSATLTVRFSMQETNSIKTETINENRL